MERPPRRRGQRRSQFALVFVLTSTLSVSVAHAVSTVGPRGDALPMARSDEEPAISTTGLWPMAGIPSQAEDSLATDVRDAGFDVPTEVVIEASPAQKVRELSGATDTDIPFAALAAYKRAETVLAETGPGCHLSWPVLAGIGRVESNHGRYAGSQVYSDGSTHPHIVGLPLNGVGPVAEIADTDGGRLDGDPTWDRAVGPMQFIPTTWAVVGLDGDGDGVRDPHDLDDAALAAGVYLCGGDRDMSTTEGLRAAIYSYNHSQDYVDLVLSYAQRYEAGVSVVPATGGTSPGTGTTTSPSSPSTGSTTTTASGPVGDAQGEEVKPPKPDRPDTVQGEEHPPPKPPKPPKPDPEPEPEPEPVTLTGVLRQDEQQWAIDDTVLDFGNADLTVVREDYDADGTAEATTDELVGLTGIEVTVVISPDGIVTDIADLPFDATLG